MKTVAERAAIAKELIAHAQLSDSPQYSEAKVWSRGDEVRIYLNGVRVSYASNTGRRSETKNNSYYTVETDGSVTGGRGGLVRWAELGKAEAERLREIARLDFDAEMAEATEFVEGWVARRQEKGLDIDAEFIERMKNKPNEILVARQRLQMVGLDWK